MHRFSGTKDPIKKLWKKISFQSCALTTLGNISVWEIEQDASSSSKIHKTARKKTNSSSTSLNFNHTPENSIHYAAWTWNKK